MQGAVDRVVPDGRQYRQYCSSESLAAFQPYIDASSLSTGEFNFLDGRKDVNGTWQTRHGQVSLHDIGAHLRTPRAPEAEPPIQRFRVLCFPRRPNRPGRQTIDIPQHTFQDIASCWQLHELTAETFLSMNGVYETFHSFKCSQSTVSVLAKMPSWRPVGVDAVSITHDKANRITYVLYHGLGNEKAVIDRITTSIDYVANHLLFVAVLYRQYQVQFERYRILVDDKLVKVQRQTKFGGLGMLDTYYPQFKGLGGGENHEDLATQLSYCQTEIAIMGNVARINRDCGVWLQQLLQESSCEVRERISKDAKQARRTDDTARSGDGADSLLLDASCSILEEVRFATCLAKCALSQIEHLRERAQAQTTLMLSLIAQNDSKYSSSIAVDSKRDSTAMKTIAVLTTLFLPGTFVATFFSMSMFDWKPESGSGSVTSPYLWVYWVISIPLTLLVMMVWLVWSRKEYGKRQREIEEMSKKD